MVRDVRLSQNPGQDTRLKALRRYEREETGLGMMIVNGSVWANLVDVPFTVVHYSLIFPFRHDPPLTGRPATSGANPVKNRPPTQRSPSNGD